MTGTPKKMAKKFEEQTTVQRKEHYMLMAHQQSISELKNMVALLLEKPKKKKTRASSLKPGSSPGHLSKGKDKEAEHFIFEEPKSKESSKDELPQSSSEEGCSEHSEDPHLKKMKELEERLEAIAYRGDLHDVGLIRSYPVEWDSAPYPPRFKAPTLHTFDGKGSPNQHIYYFKSQTRNVVSNDVIMTQLFIGTLKGIAFEWFMKLSAGSINKWVDL